MTGRDHVAARGGLVVLVAAAASSGMAALAGAQSVAPVIVPAGVHGPTGARMDDYLRRATAFGFSGQVLVARRGEVLLHQAYGFADRARHAPLTLNTRVGVASMSKQFAAAAILKLDAEGRLSLRDSLGAFFDDVPADKRGITLQQLLTHTSGIRGGTTEDFDMPSLEASMKRLFSLPLTGPVGGKWRYSSDAYGIIAAVVQRVSGKPYAEYMRTALFAAAGMVHTGLWPDAPATTDSVARAYTGWRDRGTPREWPTNWRVFGSGDLMTTVGDLYRWDRALREGRVLAATTVAKYTSAQVPVTADSSDWYGYGLFVSQTKRGKVVEHGGDTELGYNGAFFRYMDADAVMIIVSNASDYYQRSLRRYVEEDLEAMLFGSDTTQLPPDGRPLAPSALSALAGDYAVSGGVLRLISDGAHLWAAAEGEPLVAQLRRVRTGEDPAMYGRANDRTAALLTRLVTLDTGAFDSVLGDSAASLRKEYVDEWNALTATFGPINGFDILGAVREGPSILVHARLKLRDSDEVMTFRWSQLGNGRLSGTNPRPKARFPIIMPVARLATRELVVHDLWLQQERARLRPMDGGRLRFQATGDPASRRAPVVTAAVRRVGAQTP